MLVHLGFFYALVLGSAILEPDFDLCFCEMEYLSQLKPPGSGDVLGPLVLQLQLQSLLAGEGGTLTSLLRLLATTTWNCHKYNQNGGYPRKIGTFNPCCFNVGTTLKRHLVNVSCLLYISLLYISFSLIKQLVQSCENQNCLYNIIN